MEKKKVKRILSDRALELVMRDVLEGVKEMSLELINPAALEQMKVLMQRESGEKQGLPRFTSLSYADLFARIRSAKLNS